MDIILALSDKFSDKEHQDILVPNAFAQAESLYVRLKHMNRQKLN